MVVPLRGFTLSPGREIDASRSEVRSYPPCDGEWIRKREHLYLRLKDGRELDGRLVAVECVPESTLMLELPGTEWGLAGEGHAIRSVPKREITEIRVEGVLIRGLGAMVGLAVDVGVAFLILDSLGFGGLAGAGQ